MTYPNTISLEESAFKAIWCSRQRKTYLRLHAKCPIFLPDFNQVWSSSTRFSIEVPHIKFDRNPSSGNGIATTCRRTYGWTNTRLKEFFIGYAKAPKMYLYFSCDCVSKQWLFLWTELGLTGWYLQRRFTVDFMPVDIDFLECYLNKFQARIFSGAYSVLFDQRHGKRPLWRHRQRWVCNLKLISKKYDWEEGRWGTGLIWPRIETRGGLLSARK